VAGLGGDAPPLAEAIEPLAVEVAAGHEPGLRVHGVAAGVARRDQLRRLRQEIVVPGADPGGADDPGSIGGGARHLRSPRGRGVEGATNDTARRPGPGGPGWAAGRGAAGDAV